MGCSCSRHTHRTARWPTASNKISASSNGATNSDSPRCGSASISPHRGSRIRPAISSSRQAIPRTERITLCAGAYVVPFYHPAALALRIAQLDHMAQGPLHLRHRGRLDRDRLRAVAASTRWPGQRARHDARRDRDHACVSGTTRRRMDLRRQALDGDEPAAVPRVSFAHAAVPAAPSTHWYRGIVASLATASATPARTASSR